MSVADDKSLIQGLAEAREDAFAALYDRFGAGLFRVALAVLGSRQDAEDAVQEVFVSLVRARLKLIGVESLPAYLFASLRHTAIKLAANRKFRTRQDCSDLSLIPAPQKVTIEIDSSARLERALRQLPAEQREVVALKLEGRLTFAEIGSLLGISANTVAGRYRYALEKLRDALLERSDGPSR